MQKRRNLSALARDLSLSCIKPSIYEWSASMINMFVFSNV